MDSVFKALADPTRRRILELLKKEAMTPGELLPHFDITGASLSHHLHILMEADLISQQKKGQQRVYTINLSIFEQVMHWLMSMERKPGGSGQED